MQKNQLREMEQLLESMTKKDLQKVINEKTHNKINLTKLAKLMGLSQDKILQSSKAKKSIESYEEKWRENGMLKKSTPPANFESLKKECLAIDKMYENSTELAKDKSSLYRRINLHPRKYELYRIFRFRIPPRYLTTQELIGKVGEYRNWHDLHDRYRMLWEETHERGLKKSVNIHYPNFDSSNDYIGIAGYAYSSWYELIFGNLLMLLGFNFELHKDLLFRGERHYVSDFYLPEYNMYVEILQNEINQQRSSRHKEYATHLKRKKKYYKKCKLRVVYINSLDLKLSSFYLLSCEVLTKEFNIISFPDFYESAYIKVQKWKKYIEMDLNDLVDYLLFEYKIFVRLYNKDSRFYKYLQAREDFESVMKEFKKKTTAIGHKKAWETRRRKYLRTQLSLKK